VFPPLQLPPLTFPQICEKEAKTKMFSKEGLAREQKIDPREAAKNNTRDWLGNCLSTLNNQIESFDADLEKLTAVTKGKERKMVPCI